MKPIRSIFLTAWLWSILALASFGARAATYPVTISPGFNLVANHVASAPIQTLLPLSFPTTADMQALFQLTSPYPPSGGSIFINDGVDWLDSVTGNPAVYTIANGEGMWLYNPTASQLNANFIGPANPFVTPLLPAVPGWHMAGRQTIGPGTFESSFGRSPRDYNFVHVYRWDSAAQNYVPTIYQFAQAANPANRKWSPSAPILNVGEAGWFRLGNNSPSFGSNPQFAPNPVNFTITGVTPANGSQIASPVALSVTGTGLVNGDQVRLRRMGAGVQPQTPWTGGVADPEGFILTASMNVAALPQGYYKVMVRKPPTGTPQTLNNVFHMKATSSQLKVALTGPTLALAAAVTPAYQLTLQNMFGPAVANVDLSVVVPGYPANVSINTLSGPGVLTIGGVGIQTLTPFTIPAGAMMTWSFTLTPSAVLLTTSPTTVQLRARITAPAAEVDQARRPVEVVASLDPNEKHGPIGSGPERYITGLDPSDYTVTFENDPTATAPAHVVSVIDQLDTTRFDLATFELNPVTFGSKVVVPPAGLQTWTHDEPYDVDGDPLTLADNILVRIDAALDANLISPTFGQVKWTFSSLESAPPHLPVTLPNVGFLPANVTAPEGQGSVAFRVMPFSNLSSGDTFKNDASIIFDNNPAILTGTWINTIDLDEPSSSVGELPTTQSTASFPVSWSGNDPDSGIATYDVYVSDNNGPDTLWQSATTATTAIFNGQLNHSYRFYSVALDNVGNGEEAPETPDASTTVSLTYITPLLPGFNWIANPLDHGGNTLNEIFPGMPVEAEFYKWDCLVQDFVAVAFFDGVEWVDINTGLPLRVTLVPGEGAMIFNPEAYSIHVAFTGTPHVPVLPPPQACGCGQLSALSLQAEGIGTFENITGKPPVEGSRVIQFSSITQNYNVPYAFSEGSWISEETGGLGEPIVNFRQAALFYSPCVTPPCITLQCASNLVVECDSEWSFTPPQASNACCGGIVTSTVLSTVTNGIWPQTITRTWLATDACGNSATCSQSVTVRRDIESAGPNLLVNGSFELPSIGDTAFTYLDDVPGWTGKNGSTFIEYWSATEGSLPAFGGVVPADGNQQMEISANVAIQSVCQVVNNPTPGVPMTLRFNYTGRPGGFDNHFTVEVSDGTGVLLSASLNPASYAVGGWQSFSTSFTSALSTLTIGFNGMPADGQTGGAHIDNVSLTQGPSPLTLACATNKTVECGSTWVFDPPTSLGNSATVTVLGTLTNGLCPQTITRTWLAADACGNTAQCSQTVTVVDTTPPVITGCRHILTNSLASNNGNFVTYPLPGAVDSCDGPVAVNCEPSSGSFFSIGQTLVHCVATDGCDNTNTCSFIVTVRGVCVEIISERFSCAGTNGGASFELCVRNNSDHSLGHLTLVDLPLGVVATPYFLTFATPVPPGQTGCVTLTMSGLGERTNVCFRLMAHSPDFEECCIISHCTPVNFRPPQINCVENIEVLTGANETNAVVHYSVTATSPNGSPVTVGCSPPSDTAFPIGVTQVNCVATDACGNTNTCSFTVTVKLGRGDLWITDTPYNYTGATPDQGGEPDAGMIPEQMWMSSGIWMHQDCVQPPGNHLTHQNPRYGQQNCLFAEVRNRGNVSVTGAKVEFWYANASLGLTWPAQWTLIGTVTLTTAINPGGSAIAQAPWFPVGTGHYCLLARISPATEPMTHPETSSIWTNVRQNNNLAWRNVNVTDCLHTPGDKVEVRVRNFEPAPKKLTLVFTADDDFLIDGGVAILSPGSTLFQRWMDAGGKGSNFEIINGNEIRFTGSPATFEDIPFGENEERIFNLTLRADQPMPVPGASHTYHAHLMQKIDGVTVGGVSYTIVTRAADTDTDGDGLPDITDPDDDGDGIIDNEDPHPIGEPNCLPAALTINRTGQEVTITWSGLNYHLQSVHNFGDAWEDVVGASSPYVRTTDGDHRFFRLICR